jgi:catechol 2,3-dioxygenase-like lactoylglutathione lyase family enzyme
VSRERSSRAKRDGTRSPRDGKRSPRDGKRPRRVRRYDRAVSVQELRVVLTVEDHEQALAFYRDALGLPQLEDWSSDEGKVVLLDGGRATIELVDASQAALIDDVEVGRRVAGPVRLALHVGDSVLAAEALEAAGAERIGDPVETPWRDRNVRLRAPDGMQLTLFSPMDD